MSLSVVLIMIYLTGVLVSLNTWSDYDFPRGQGLAKISVYVLSVLAYSLIWPILVVLAFYHRLKGSS